MKILFITTYYPPMTSIASVRPWALCHYMAQYGNDVTVLCAGKVGTGKSNDLYKNLDTVRVVRCFPLAQDSSKDSTKSNRGSNVFRILKAAYRKIDGFLQNYGSYLLYFVTRWITAYYYYKREKIEINKLKKSGESFDVVISTFGGAENFFAGKYAADCFQCPLVQDFRDTISSGYCDSGLIRGYINRKVEKWAIKNADAITGVSDDMLRHMMEVLHINATYNVIYNGYVPLELVGGNKFINKEKLNFCYTGTIYEKDDFSALFSVVNKLIKKGIVQKNKIAINYAGGSWDRLVCQAKKYGLTDIIFNYGYLTFDDTFDLQRNSDIFLVASWNNDDDVGVICGKFSEGVRIRKPIVCLVSGKKPNSELYRLNEKYKYGFCYENASKTNSEPELEEFLVKQYKRKINGESIHYNPHSNLFIDLRYDYLAKKMEEVCKKIQVNQL